VFEGFESCRTGVLKPNSITLSVWKLVADRFEAGPRPASNLSATCRDSSNLLEAGRRPVRSQILLRYLVADMFESGSKLVADRFEAGRGRAGWCYFAASKLDDRPNFSSLQVCDQLRTCLRPDSVMEFGLYRPLLTR